MRRHTSIDFELWILTFFNWEIRLFSERAQNCVDLNILSKSVVYIKFSNISPDRIQSHHHKILQNIFTRVAYLPFVTIFR
jgi:hypothetical protein